MTFTPPCLYAYLFNWHGWRKTLLPEFSRLAVWSAACVSLGPQVIPEAHYRITKQELYSFFYAFQAFSNPRAVCNRSIPHAKAEALMLLPCPPMKAPDSSGNCRKDTTLFREVSQKYIYRCTYQIFTEHLLNKRHHTSSLCSKAFSIFCAKCVHSLVKPLLLFFLKEVKIKILQKRKISQVFEVENNLAWIAHTHAVIQLLSHVQLCNPIDYSMPGLPCPSLSPGVCSNSCPLSHWCYPTISSSVASFSFCPQSFPASGSFPMIWLFASGGQSIGTSALVLPMNIQGWFSLGLTACTYNL